MKIAKSFVASILSFALIFTLYVKPTAAAYNSVQPSFSTQQEESYSFLLYADKQELEESIIRRHYGTIVMDSEQPQGGGTSAGGMAQGIQAAPDSRKTVFRP